MDDDDDGADAVPGDPMIELGEEIRVPADWSTRKSYLETEFELFERAGLRYYHHVNGLFILFLSKTHPLFSHPQRATAQLVYSEASRKILQVSGKKRKGAPRTEPGTVVARVVLGDGTAFDVAAGIKGFVVEINERMTGPLLLDPDAPEAYLAILQPKSDFVARASFVPGMLEEARERRAKKQLKKDEKEKEAEQEDD